MAKRVGLSIYGMSLYDGEQERNINLNDVKNFKNILQIINEYIDYTGDDYSKDWAKEKVYKFDNVVLEDVKVGGREEYSILSGLVKTGEYGVQSELFDIADGSTSEKRPTQAEVLPFGFCIAVAKGNKTKAVVILQTFGNLGIKTVFTKYLNKCIRHNKLELSLLLEPLYPIQYIERIMKKGILQKIRMIRYEVPEDIATSLGVNNGVSLKEERVIFKPVGFLKSKRNIIMECLRGQRASTEVLEIPGFDYDQLKLEFSVKNKTKTINFNDTQELRINEDITDEVAIHQGIPVFNSLKECMKSTAYEYLGLMGVTVK